jgi:transposase
MRQIYGIDLSKEKFDVNFLDEKRKEQHLVIKNDLKNIVKFLGSISSEALVVAEHTGVYGNLLLFLCNQTGISISLCSGYSIKHSLGLRKGKTDKIDAARIREFGERFYDKLKETKINSELMLELHELYSLRSHLVKERKMLLTKLKGTNRQPIMSIYANKVSTRLITHLSKEIEQTEGQLLEIISSDKSLEKNFNLTTSIKGIGPVTACELIIKTVNFKKIQTAKKAASYAGICPFPNASGQMVKKSRVSAMSDKSLKSMLFMCAKSAVAHNQEYRLYYKKKELEGKPHYLIMTNVANKLLRTVYKVIETGTPWDPNYICLDPREQKNKVA